MSLDVRTDTEPGTPDGVIFLPETDASRGERPPTAYTDALHAAESAELTADNLRRLAEEYRQLAAAWDGKAAEYAARAQFILDRHMGQRAVEAAALVE